MTRESGVQDQPGVRSRLLDRERDTQTDRHGPYLVLYTGLVHEVDSLDLSSAHSSPETEAQREGDQNVIKSLSFSQSQSQETQHGSWRGGADV